MQKRQTKKEERKVKTKREMKLEKSLTTEVSSKVRYVSIGQLVEKWIDANF